MLEVREFSVSEYIDRVVGLVRAHWLETESELAPGGPKPLVGIYLALEKAGSIIAFGAFEDGTMVGYSVAILGPHLHYGMTYAHHDLLYVSPEHRRGMLGLKLIRATERAAKARGAAFSTWHAKPGGTLESILSRTGYQREEIVYKKDL